MSRTTVNGALANTLFNSSIASGSISASFARNAGLVGGAQRGDFMVASDYEGRQFATLVSLRVCPALEVDVTIGMDWIGLCHAVGAEGRSPVIRNSEQMVEIDMEIDDLVEHSVDSVLQARLHHGEASGSKLDDVSESQSLLRDIYGGEYRHGVRCSAFASDGGVRESLALHGIDTCDMATDKCEEALLYHLLTGSGLCRFMRPSPIFF
ncbi:hypothetical protein BJ138DRAFT_629991 [Hygrophoropsis aurantiaca]|uniref:Uncharacterized protein n=1 Tax=Hygrophoropsis aurantiaca TaxID=72124 RepID=A0ACB8A1D0_9AGAM|nr:hypothetical protein BJ138DRAFT_629991 [Hygrophoropsis aurantiaca]